MDLPHAVLKVSAVYLKPSPQVRKDKSVSGVLVSCFYFQLTEIGSALATLGYSPWFP